MRDLLLFHKVVKVEGDDQNAELTLDNGVKLYTEGNLGCGGCGNGWYYLVALNNCDNVITNDFAELLNYLFDKECEQFGNYAVVEVCMSD